MTPQKEAREPRKLHLEQLAIHLPEISAKLKKIVVSISGENPWE